MVKSQSDLQVHNMQPEEIIESFECRCSVIVGKDVYCPMAKINQGPHQIQLCQKDPGYRKAFWSRAGRKIPESIPGRIELSSVLQTDTTKCQYEG